MSVFTLSAEEITINADPDKLGLYVFDSKVAKHYFCKKCGIYPFHQTLRKPGYYRVNLGCIDEIDTSQLDVEIFDGKSI